MATAEAAAGRGPDISPAPDPHQLEDQGRSQEGLVPGPGPGSPRPRMVQSKRQASGGSSPSGPRQEVGALGQAQAGHICVISRGSPGDIPNSKGCVLQTLNMQMKPEV